MVPQSTANKKKTEKFVYPQYNWYNLIYNWLSVLDSFVGS